MIGWTLCSGIGAPEVAAPWVDWRLAAEIEPFPRAVLQQRLGYRAPEDHNQGDPLLWGDMTEVTPELARSRGVPLPDLLVAGTPCQAFSVAGLRGGVADERGNLTLKFVETCHAIADARPDGKLAVLWENVPGVLSDKENAFGCFMGGLVGSVAPLRSPDGGSWPSEGMVQGPRARLSWSVLDGQWFGVAQRRRRVFVVVDFGNCVDPAAVLLEPDRLRGDTPPSRETGQDVTLPVAPCLRGRGNASHRLDTEAVVASHDPAATLQTSCDDYSRADGFNMVAHTLRGEGFDTSEDGTGRGTPLAPVAFDCKGTEVQHDESGVSPPLRSMGHNSSHQNAGGHAAIAIQERAVATNPNCGPQGSGFRDDDTAYTLEARNKVQAVAFAENQLGEVRLDDVFPTLSIGGVKPGQGYPAVAFDLRGREGGAQVESIGDTVSLRAADGGSSRSYIAQPWAVRRLTPTECHRLQGFKDDHCAVTIRNKPAADGPQCKALGNSMAVPCVKWILDRMHISIANMGK